jgi:prophage maintenance system killer protein
LVVLLYTFLRANDHDLTLTDDELFRLAVAIHPEQHLTIEQVDAAMRPTVVPYALLDESE